MSSLQPSTGDTKVNKAKLLPTETQSVAEKAVSFALREIKTYASSFQKPSFKVAAQGLK